MSNEIQINNQATPSTLGNVKWLADILEMTVDQTYKAIRAKDIPEECVLRVGRRVKIRRKKALRWIEGDG